MQEYNDRENEMIIYTSRTVWYKNVKILKTNATIMNLEVWQEAVTKAYIQAYDMQRDVCVKPVAQFKLGQ